MELPEKVIGGIVKDLSYSYKAPRLRCLTVIWINFLNVRKSNEWKVVLFYHLLNVSVLSHEKWNFVSFDSHYRERKFKWVSGGYLTGKVQLILCIRRLINCVEMNLKATRVSFHCECHWVFPKNPVKFLKPFHKLFAWIVCA